LWTDARAKAAAKAEAIARAKRLEQNARKNDTIEEQPEGEGKAAESLGTAANRLKEDVWDDSAQANVSDEEESVAEEEEVETGPITVAEAEARLSWALHTAGLTHHRERLDENSYDYMVCQLADDSDWEEIGMPAADMTELRAALREVRRRVARGQESFVDEIPDTNDSGGGDREVDSQSAKTLSLPFSVATTAPPPPPTEEKQDQEQQEPKKSTSMDWMEKEREVRQRQIAEIKAQQEQQARWWQQQQELEQQELEQQELEQQQALDRAAVAAAAAAEETAGKQAPEPRMMDLPPPPSPPRLVDQAGNGSPRPGCSWDADDASKGRNDEASSPPDPAVEIEIPKTLVDWGSFGTRDILVVDTACPENGRQISKQDLEDNFQEFGLVYAYVQPPKHNKKRSKYRSKQNTHATYALLRFAEPAAGARLLRCGQYEMTLGGGHGHDDKEPSEEMTRLVAVKPAESTSPAR